MKKEPNNAAPGQSIDIVMYLASLVSSPTAVDPILDKVRFITARLGPNKAPTQTDEVELGEVQAQLKDYLIKEDPIRRFDPEVLEAHIYEQFKGNARFRQLKRWGWGIILVSFAAAIAVYTLGTVFHIPPEIKGPNAFVATFGILNVGAVWLFIKALPGFSPQLRSAYILMSVAVGIIGMNQVHLIILRLFPSTYWEEAQMFNVFFTVAAYLIYLALCRFMSVLGLKSRLVRWRFVIFATLATTTISLLVPHSQENVSLPLYLGSVVAMSVMALFVTLSLILTLYVIRAVSELYKQALRVFFAALGLLGLGGNLFLLIRLVWTSPNDLVFPQVLVMVAAVLLLVVSALLFLRSAYLFNRLARY